jgi:propanol-preferring alcohol dehydrogenase
VLGLDAYSALKRIASDAARGPVLLVGMGGVGMMGLALARVMFAQAPIVADIHPAKREAALQAGAAAAFDPADPGARKALLAQSGGISAACDFVGSESSLQFAYSALARGGKLVITGLLGGTLSTPIALIAIKALSIEGVLAGTLAEAHELFDIARAGKITPLPISERPLEEAQRALEDLRRGRVVGRVVLKA